MIKARVFVMVEFTDDWKSRVVAFYDDLEQSGLTIGDDYLEVADEHCEPIYACARNRDLRIVVSIDYATVDVYEGGHLL